MTLPPQPPPDTSFDELPPKHQELIRTCGDQMVCLAQKYAGGLIIAPPPSEGGEIRTASYCLFKRGGTTYLATANHVLVKSEELMAENPSVVWQAGDLIFDPRDRLVDRDSGNDVALIELRPGEAEKAGVLICSIIPDWPPPRPQPGDFILASGYPALILKQPTQRRVEFWALSVLLEVTSAGDYHVFSKWERENMIRFGGEGPGIPPPNLNLGGMSGGPVLLVRNLTYPLVAVVTDFHSDWELMRFGHLSAVQVP